MPALSGQDAVLTGRFNEGVVYTSSGIWRSPEIANFLAKSRDNFQSSENDAGLRGHAVDTLMSDACVS